jgi:ADP-heptose:LPS heptosyltransferase
LLVIRLDNMGDLLMSVPAINALKETFNCNISVLTSSTAEGVARLIEAIDEVIIFDAPWMKARKEHSQLEILNVVKVLKTKEFDAAVVFTVFSQNPLPAVMLAYLAEIPRRLAYCRENPYQLLTEWVPDDEPYQHVRHQVRRDLHLVNQVGARVTDESISLKLPADKWVSAQAKLKMAGVNLENPWIVMHPGVSELKRQFQTPGWIDAAKKLKSFLNQQIVLTGSEAEKGMANSIRLNSGERVFSLAGELSLDEFIMVLRHAPLVISVNTATAHLAAATKTKIIVLYAMTNPQHTPWKSAGRVLPFSIPEELKSKNEILRFVDKNFFPPTDLFISTEDIVEAARDLLNSDDPIQIPENVDFLSFTKNTMARPSPDHIVRLAEPYT